MIPLIFPKVPQSSLGILRVPQLPPPLRHPPLKNPIRNPPKPAVLPPRPFPPQDLPVRRAPCGAVDSQVTSVDTRKFTSSSTDNFVRSGYTLELPTGPQDSSHHQDYEPFLVGNPELNLPLMTVTGLGGRPKAYHNLHHKISHQPHHTIFWIRDRILRKKCENIWCQHAVCCGRDLLRDGIRVYHGIFLKENLTHSLGE